MLFLYIINSWIAHEKTIRESRLSNKIEVVAKFHKVYEARVLADRLARKDVYLQDPHQALFLIFSHCFYQGRRDPLSEKFHKIAEDTCRDFFIEHDYVLQESAQRITKKETLKSKYDHFERLLHSCGLNKEGDRLMVISLINFIQSCPEKNILCHIIERIQSQQLAQIYRELDDVWSIGPKISSLILRDIVYMYQLEEYFKDVNSYSYLQPVDTWVHQVAEKLGMIPSEKNIYQGEAVDITRKCLEAGVNPIHFNQGAWYLGARSIDIVLENLDRIRAKL
jgi:hypothetical protein